MKAHAIRFAARIVLAAATLTVNAIANPAIADAAREWDVRFYDQCSDSADKAYFADETTSGEEWLAELKYCCDASGGVNLPDGRAPRPLR